MSVIAKKAGRRRAEHFDKLNCRPAAYHWKTQLSKVFSNQFNGALLTIQGNFFQQLPSYWHQLALHIGLKSNAEII